MPTDDAYERGYAEGVQAASEKTHGTPASLRSFTERVEREEQISEAARTWNRGFAQGYTDNYEIVLHAS